LTFIRWRKWCNHQFWNWFKLLGNPIFSHQIAVIIENCFDILLFADIILVDILFCVMLFIVPTFRFQWLKFWDIQIIWAQYEYHIHQLLFWFVNNFNRRIFKNYFLFVLSFFTPTDFRTSVNRAYISNLFPRRLFIFIHQINKFETFFIIFSHHFVIDYLLLVFWTLIFRFELCHIMYSLFLRRYSVLLT
jgi:hypothetical protein